MIFPIFKFLYNHPLNSSHLHRSLLRFMKWQIASKVLNLPAIIPFVNESKLIAERGISIGPGNYYVGLLEYEEMAFTLHYLRPEDTFIDIGANIGVYTILSAGVIGADCISIEPIPDTFQRLLDNINLNRINSKVTTLNAGLAETSGKLQFTKGFSSINHVFTSTDTINKMIEVEVTTLDIVAANRHIEVAKIDVEGYEGRVITGGEKTFTKKDKPNIVLLELRGHGKRYNINEQDIHNKMLNYGYSPYTYDPSNRSINLWKQNDNDSLGDMLYISDVNKAKSRVQSSKPFSVAGKTL